MTMKDGFYELVYQLVRPTRLSLRYKILYFLDRSNHNKTLQIVAKLLHRFLTTVRYEQYLPFPYCGLFYKI